VIPSVLVKIPPLEPTATHKLFAYFTHFVGVVLRVVHENPFVLVEIPLFVFYCNFLF
jgi:hypothetical protein